MQNRFTYKPLQKEPDNATFESCGEWNPEDEDGNETSKAFEEMDKKVVML